MKLCELIDCPYDIDITGIADDSRDVRDGFLFVATKGYNVDHFDYISDAIDNGAVCFVVDREIDVDIPYIIVNNINNKYIELCSKFYEVSPDDFSLIGVTGTDGKTTTATIISQLLDNTACIGTNGILVNNEYYETHNTTPCISELYSSLNLIKSFDCKDVVMEVSSEALLHQRVRMFKYDIACFTNITEDHLNVHKNIENYKNCKLKLLQLLKENSKIVINGDDENCKEIAGENVFKIGFGFDNDFVIENVKELSNCVNFNVRYKGNFYNLSSPFLGLYNVYNVTMAFAVCLLKGLDTRVLINKIKDLKSISGRREYLDFGQDFDIILDYAHTYNGIKNILESVNRYKKIITVTGAAGGREKEKRSKIGKLVLEKSNVAILTMDDPRYESVDEIIDQMVSLCSDMEYIRIIDRKMAISKAIELADKDSVVLVLGKGRDNYMAIEDRKEKYCDFDVIKELLSK